MSQMKDFRERMKAKAALTPAKLEEAESIKGLPPVVGKEPTQPMAKKKNPPEIAGTVAYKCGHTRPLKAFSGDHCPQCRNDAKRAKKERRAKANAELPPKIPTPTTERLPSGSRKILHWDGTNWTGILTIPGIEKPFTFTATSEKRCYHGLHDEWVKSKKVIDETKITE